MVFLRFILVFGIIFNILTPTSAQQFLSKTLVHDGNTREYSLYVPDSYDGTVALPLLFNFHGGSGDIASQIAIADMRSIADTAGFLLVYPQAWPDPNDGGSTNWTHKAPSTIDDVFFVEAMIDAVAADYTIDQERVYACGYSNGGEFTLELACRLSNRIAAVGVVARSMFIDTYNACAPTHPMGVLTIHGTKDEYEGITWAGTTYYISLDDLNAYWANYNNTEAIPSITAVPNTSQNDGSTVERHVWSQGDGCVSVEHLKVLNGGHDWPGSFGNMDIDASDEIWKFVSKHNKNGLIGCSTSINATASEFSVIQFFPNPTRDFVALKNATLEGTSYQIYSMQGVLLRSGIVDTVGQGIDLQGLDTGIYVVRIGRFVGRVLKN